MAGLGATIMHNHRKQTSSERTEADTFNSTVNHVLYLKNSFSRQTHDYVVPGVA